MPSPRGDGRFGGRKELAPPSAEEIVNFARYLGMDPVFDSHLLWVAEEALTAPLPSHWTEHIDDDDFPYYYNNETDVSTRQHPLDEYYKSLYLKMAGKEELKKFGGAKKTPPSGERSQRESQRDSCRSDATEFYTPREMTEREVIEMAEHA